MKHIRGGYVVTAAGRQIGIDRNLRREDLNFNFENDYIAIPKNTKGPRKLMTAEGVPANDSPSSSFVNYTNRVRRDQTKMIYDRISEGATTLHNNEQTFS